MAPITEFISIELDPSIDPEDPMSPGSMIWKQAISELASQPGCLGLQWARRVESPEWLVIKIDWNTWEDYAAPDGHKHFEELMAPLYTNKPLISDAASYEPFTASEVLSAAPTIEILTLLTPSSWSSEQTAALELAGVKVSTSTLSRPDGVKAVTHAWLMSEVDHPDSPTGKAKALRFLLAWPSLQVHHEVMATDEFKKNMGPIKAKCLPPVYGRGMFHAEFSTANSLSYLKR
ncbi:hypothetical protein BP5796_05728 [Coleophoma crateriformis]|uniref:ABM domain-containing protein n=1 Tax=Coleophoma crateriformis TaxID=565419 RepID=A0A3D8RV75_9HELO|nr:hypothetical protein BP5796_05728 [Coleophoma crateriformis]